MGERCVTCQVERVTLVAICHKVWHMDTSPAINQTAGAIIAARLGMLGYSKR